MESKNIDLDKLSIFLHKYNYNYIQMNLNLIKKNENCIFFEIKVLYDDGTYFKKEYKKYLKKYNRKKNISKNSLNNLKHIKKENDTINIIDRMENFSTQNMGLISNRCADNTININEKQNQYNIDILQDTKKIEKDKICKSIGNDKFDEEIDNTNCYNCQIKGNNISYLSNLLSKTFIGDIKKINNLIENANGTMKVLEDLINLENIKTNKLYHEINSIINNKKKLNNDNIKKIKHNISILEKEIPDISIILKNNILDNLNIILHDKKEEYRQYLYGQICD